MFAWEKKNGNTYEFKLSHFSIELMKTNKDTYDVYIRTPKINSNLPRLEQLTNVTLENAKTQAFSLAKDMLTEMLDLIELACYELDVSANDTTSVPDSACDKKIIWTNADVITEETIEQFMLDHLGDEQVYTDESVTMALYDENSIWRDAEKMNLDAGEPFDAVIIEEMHLWNGIRYNARIVKDVTPAVIFATGREYDETVMFAENGDIQMHTSHHDGTNEFLFRKVPKNTDMSELKHIIEAYMAGPKPRNTTTFTNLMAATESMYPDVARIYGWD